MRGKCLLCDPGAPSDVWTVFGESSEAFAWVLTYMIVAAKVFEYYVEY